MTGRYQLLRKAHSGDRFEIFRAQRAEDGRPVILKTCRPGRSRSECGELLQHELEVLQRLDLEGVARPLELAMLDGSPALILEDAGTQSLADHLQGKPLGVGRFLELAIQMAGIIAELHGRNVIHRNVCPDNFVVGETVTLVGFSSATTVPAFTQAAAGPGRLECMLAYVAPEQTGRTRRLVDHRADLYALGAIFYEMLVGAPPFPGSDPLEVVHAHVARSPYAPAVLNPGVPTLLSDVVLKLLAKLPERRYQSAEALRLDLEEARRQWQAQGSISKFEIGRLDVPRGLFVQGRLYGRDRERAQLEQLFERVAGGGREVSFISGRAGVGKSALVGELQEAVAGRCRWLEGKGDLLRGNEPYASILSAFGGLISTLLDQPEPELAALRDRLQKAIRPAGRVLTDAIPGLERLIGQQPPVPEVGPVEAANRFGLVFTSFIGALGEPGAPTVLFLDDVQWADVASLELLRAVAADPDIQNLLVLAAYRSEEVPPDHPLQRAIEGARQAGAHVTTLELGPLDEATLVLFLRDVLRTSQQQAEQLARVMSQKTAGNPFSVRRLLGLLYRERALTFHPDRGEWTWDLGQIVGLEIAEGAVEIAAANIHSQSPATQRVLQTGACIGNQFDLAVLAAVLERPLEEVAQALWGPLRDGLLIPAEGPQFAWASTNPVELRSVLAPSYRFAHDRIQQAAYQLLTEDERAELHLKIGLYLWRAAPPSLLEAESCPVVDQLERAKSRLPVERRTWLAQMNHRAGRRARSTAAYASAFAYFRQGLELLPEDAWRAQHGLWFLLQRDAAECATLAGEHAPADRLIDEGLARSEDLLEKAAFYGLAIVANTGRGLHREAIRRGEQALRLWGMDLAEDLASGAIDAEKGRARALLSTRSAEELLEAPQLPADPKWEAQLQLLLRITAPAWYASVELFKLVAARAARMSLERGLTPEAATACASYAASLAIGGEYQEAHQVGLTALRLAARLANPAQECQVMFMLGGHVNPWREPLRQSIPLLRRSQLLGVQSGELQFSAYAALNLLQALFTTGMDLDQVISEAASVLAQFRKTGHRWDALHAVLVRQVARRLKGSTRSASSFDDQEFDEASFLAAASGNIPAQGLFHHYRLQAGYLLGDLASASEAFESAKRFLPGFRSLFVIVDTVFYGCLVLAKRWEEASPTLRPQLLRELKDGLQQLSIWANNAPENWSHKRTLVAAELARLEGQADEPLALYQDAIECAGREEFRQDEALAHELCGWFHSRRGEKQMAALHFRAAAEGYERWGAAAKVEQLRRAQVVSLPRRVAPSFGSGPELDYLSLLKVIEALTGELETDRLLEKMIRICIEAAPAERAVLVLQEGELVVRAIANATGEVSLARSRLAQAPELPVSLLERVFRSGQAVVLGNAGREADAYFSSHGTRSVLAVPIGDPARGVLYFENNLVTEAFTPERVEVFRLLSAPIAIALQNSLLFQERHQAEAALRLLSDAGAALAESLDYEKTVARVTQLVVPALADWCIVDLLEAGALRTVAYLHADPLKLGVLAELRERYPVDLDSSRPEAAALRSGKPQLLADLSDETLRSMAHDRRQYELARSLGPRSVMVTPLLARGRVLGTVTFASSQSGRRYGPGELEIAQALARRLALAIDNAGLFRDAQQAIQARDEAIRMRDEFLSIASHELRTPLTSLQLAVRGLRVGDVPATPHNLARSLALADRQIVRLGRLVDELLSAVRIRAGRLEIELEEMDLAESVREVAGYFADDLKRAGSELEVRAPPRLAGQWDRGKLEQVLVNLLSNAIKFGAGKPILISLEESAGLARLTVTDHGIGIEPERLARVFEKFERAVSSRAYGGLGLGLYITRSIVQALGGTVRGESLGPGGGTTFTVELPTRAGAPLPGAPAPEARASA